MANIVTLSEVRPYTGVGTDALSDADLTSLISDMESKSLSYFNVYATPTKVIEIKDGNNKNQIMLNKPYPLKVLNIQTKNGALDLADITFDIFSGIISLDSRNHPYYFHYYPNSLKVKYLSAFMEKTSTITESTSDVTSGSSVVISVDDESEFSAEDWVLIEGLDGNRETAQITSKSSGQITVDELVQDHESESVITKLDTHTLLKEFIKYESAIAGGINATGGSYTFNTSWSKGDTSVSKGVPYTHFEKTIDSNIKQRDIIRQKIWNKLNPLA